MKKTQKITVKDTVEFRYLVDMDKDGILTPIQEVHLIKDILDDWYGDRNILPLANAHVVYAVVNDKISIIEEVGWTNANVGSLMEFLTQKTKYKAA